MRTTDDLREAYEAWTKRSGELIEEGRAYLPGGDTRASAHYEPYPVFIEEGSGCRVVDADGHEYVDFMNNFTSLIHGHAHPAIVAAVKAQIERGSAYAAPTRSQIELARRLCDRIASVDQLRFTSSGSEATMMAVRAARAITGRQKVMKMEGVYHGSYDLAEVSLVPLPGRRGPADRPEPVALDRSIAQSALGDVVVAPFNDSENTVRLIADHAHEIACVIVEPVQASMGMVPATREFLAAVREATTAHDVLFVLDEVVTLRVEWGGAQERYGVTPDLTAMGKYIGGGLPIGAFGGRRDILEIFDPGRDDSVMHTSTFSGNPMTMAAGAAAVASLSRSDHARLNELGDRLRAGFDRAFEREGIPGQTTGLGSLVSPLLTRRPVRGPREVLDAMSAAGHVSRYLHLGLLRRGVFSSPRGLFCISTPMGGAEIDHAIDAFGDTLAELRPVIERERPALLG